MAVLFSGPLMDRCALIFVDDSVLEMDLLYPPGLSMAGLELLALGEGVNLRFLANGPSALIESSRFTVLSKSSERRSISLVLLPVLADLPDLLPKHEVPGDGRESEDNGASQSTLWAVLVT